MWYFSFIMLDVIKLLLKDKLKEKGKTMYAAAKDNNISYATVHKMCTEEVGSVDLKILEKLCKYLDCEPGELLALEK